MSDKIDEILRRIAAGMPAGTPPGTSSPDEEIAAQAHELPGDPDCPLCQGSGYLRLDVSLGHPDFGKLQLCTCRQNQLSKQARQRLFTMSNLRELRHLTFESFQPRGHVGLPDIQASSLEMAFNHSQHFARTLNGWLLLQGTYGCGKTHLAAAIANFAVDLGVPTLFITVPDLLDSLRFSFNDQESGFEERFEEIRNVPLLIMDDFGTQNATAWAQEKLFQIINYRYVNRLPLVVTTNLSMVQIEERIRSRLQDPDLVTRVNIKAEDYRNPAHEGPKDQLLSLDSISKFTFGNFSDRRGEKLNPEELKSLEKALKAAHAFAENPRGWLVFIGPYGCGKTHLAAAIANYQASIGSEVVFVTVLDLLDYLRATFNPESRVRYDQRFEMVRSTPLLVLDDLGSQTSSPWSRDKLFQIINYRYNAELPTVITTANLLDKIDERVLSRIQDARLCTIHAITAPGYRGIPDRKRTRSR